MEYSKRLLLEDITYLFAKRVVNELFKGFTI